MDLPWLFHRLRCMGPGEIAARARRMGRDFLRRRFGRWPIALPDDGGATDAREEPLPPAAAAGGEAGGVAPAGAGAEPALVSLAERLSAGEDSFMGWGWREVGTPPRWRRDPVTDRDAPGGYGPWIDYRD